MNTDKSTQKLKFICVYLCSSVVPIVFCGCAGAPNQAHIQLRKENQNLQSQISDFHRQHATDAATIQSLQKQKGTLPTLSQSELDQLFTTHGLQLGRLSGAANLNEN